MHDIFLNIQSLYFNTPSFQLIRTSIESSLYKEKVRIRCYGLGDDNKNVFLEIKKKFDKIVYKRRIELKLSSVFSFLNGNKKELTQIEKEILYLFSFYKDLSPKVLLLYDRTAFVDTSSDLRITFDKNVRFRLNDINLRHQMNGENIFNNGGVLSEVKTSA